MNTVSTRSGMMAERLIRWFGWCCIAVQLLIWAAIALLGDRVWWTVMLLFGPRWVLALPSLGVLPWLLVDFRRAIVPAVAGFAIALFGVMGFHLGLHRASPASGVPFRVLELNAEGGSGAERQARILALFSDEHPDLIVIAECGPDLSGVVKKVPGYAARTSDFPGLCLLSRGPILDWQQRGQKDVFTQGGAGYIVRAVVSTAAGPVKVGLVHLTTPRHALDAYFDLSELPTRGPLTDANIAQRDEESRFARDWIEQGDSLPLIVAGDFNLTAESAIYRRYWGDLRNAFGRAGFGTGYTKHTRRWGVRIDHVLTNDEIGTVAVRVGSNVGSDHLPLIADLVLPRIQRTSTAR